MLMNEPASFIKSSREEVNQSLRELNGEAQLTRCQPAWFGFCLISDSITIPVGLAFYLPAPILAA
jgi:hypothetical protein